MCCRNERVTEEDYFLNQRGKYSIALWIHLGLAAINKHHSLVTMETATTIRLSPNDFHDLHHYPTITETQSPQASTWTLHGFIKAQPCNPPLFPSMSCLLLFTTLRTSLSPQLQYRIVVLILPLAPLIWSFDQRISIIWGWVKACWLADTSFGLFLFVVYLPN